MNGANLREYAEGLITPKTRWLAIGAGCVAGVAGSLSLGLGFASTASILVFGAVLQRWSPCLGRWLMWLGAFYLTLFLALFFVRPVVWTLGRPHLINESSLIFLSLAIVSMALVGWCDVALILGARRVRKAPRPANERVLRTADWIVAAFAVYLTVVTVWGTVASFYLVRRYGRWDILLLGLPLTIAVAVFDTAIAAYVFQIYRARSRQSEANK